MLRETRVGTRSTNNLSSGIVACRQLRALLGLLSPWEVNRKTWNIDPREMVMYVREFRYSNKSKKHAGE